MIQAYSQQPAYLHNLISYHQPSRSLRSSSKSLLHVPKGKTDFVCRAFSSAAPQIWNHIPTAIEVSPSLDSFKHHLKAHYFTSPKFSHHLVTDPHLWCNFFNRGALPNIYITLHYWILLNALQLNSTLTVSSTEREHTHWLVCHMDPACRTRRHAMCHLDRD